MNAMYVSRAAASQGPTFWSAMVFAAALQLAIHSSKQDRIGPMHALSGLEK